MARVTMHLTSHDMIHMISYRQIIATSKGLNTHSHRKQLSTMISRVNNRRESLLTFGDTYTATDTPIGL